MIKKRLVSYLFVGGAALLVGSPTLMTFLGTWEGEQKFQVYADKLANGLPTVCKGITRHTSPYPVVVGEVWSEVKCKEVEEKVVRDTQLGLQRCLDYPVPQQVFDALTSHAHNVGWPSTCNSQSVREINNGNIKKGCDLLAYRPDGPPNWSYAEGKFVQGLHNRRIAERKLCLSGLK